MVLFLKLVNQIEDLLGMASDFIQIWLLIDVMQELQLLTGVALEYELAFVSPIKSKSNSYRRTWLRHDVKLYCRGIG